MPIAGLEAWTQKDAAERQAEEDRMKTLWQEWSVAHAGAVKETGGAGKTKRATKAGIADAKNDLMLYSLVEAETHDAAAEIFKDHPHLQIPDAWIDITEATQLPGMQ